MEYACTLLNDEDPVRYSSEDSSGFLQIPRDSWDSVVLLFCDFCADLRGIEGSESPIRLPFFCNSS